MNLREQLKAKHYQQAVNFAENFAEPTKNAFLKELYQRQAVEQSYPPQLQKFCSKRPLVIALCGALLASLFVYNSTGRWQQAKQGMQAFSQFQQQKSAESTTQRNDHYILSLQNQLRQNANDGEKWFELGQAYSLNNDFSAAMICFHNAKGLLGETPAILGAMATADYYQQHQRLSPQAQDWINTALAHDPKESASLLLLASDAFLHHNFKQAIDYWQMALESENPALDRRAVIRSIKAAEQMEQIPQ